MNRPLMLITFAAAGAALVLAFGMPQTAIDLTGDRASSAAWRAGDNAYSPIRGLMRRYEHVDVHEYDEAQANSHPPPMILLLTPINMLPARASHVALATLEVTALLVGSSLIARRFGLSPWSALIPLAMPFVWHGLASGSVSNSLLLLIVGAGLLVESEREGVGGLLVGMAAAIKLFPLLIVVVLVLTGRRRAALAAIASFVVILSLGVAIIGISPALHWAIKVLPSDAARWTTFSENTSLFAPLYRMVGWHPWLGLAGGALCCLALTRTKYWSGLPWIVLAPPIAWPHYAAVTLPAVASIARKSPLTAAGILVLLNASVRGVLPVAATLALLCMGLYGYAKGGRERLPSGSAVGA